MPPFKKTPEDHTNVNLLKLLMWTLNSIFVCLICLYVSKLKVN
uniref:Uncharacterized protein n=1 Tax=Lepeophtheirus salmonis TaxID=72036 RepID=A0A0K2TS90_LEPSM